MEIPTEITLCELHRGELSSDLSSDDNDENGPSRRLIFLTEPKYKCRRSIQSVVWMISSINRFGLKPNQRSKDDVKHFAHLQVVIVVLEKVYAYTKN